MKQYNYRFILLALALGVAFWPVRQVKAQNVSKGDTLIVECCNADFTAIPNALGNAIAADTNSDGSRKHTVYELKRGEDYSITDAINNVGFPLTIVGQKPDPDSTFGYAPSLYIGFRSDATTGGKFFVGQSDLTLKNVWILGNDTQGNQSNYYEPMDLTGSNNRYVFEGVNFARSNFAIPAFDGSNNEIIFRSCKFLNLVEKPVTQQWAGRGISIWASQDSVIIENNTFYNIGMTSLQLEGGYANYIRINHNTIVNQGRQVEDLNKKQEYFANNLIINGFWHGEGKADYDAPGRPADQYATGIFTVNVLPSSYGLESERRIVLANTYLYRDPQLTEDYGDTIHVQPLVADSSAYFFRTNPHIVAKDTVWLDNPPTGMSEDAFSGAIIDSMWSSITGIRRGTTDPTEWWYYGPGEIGKPHNYVDGSTGPCYNCVTWPLPIDFAYDASNAIYTAGTDGLPIGDLTWFPDKLKQYKANRAKYAQDLYNMAGSVVAYKQISAVEAENGTLGGDASVYIPDGLKSFYMTTGGQIQWTFSVPETGTYNLIVQTNMANNAERGEYISVNGVNLQNRSGYGEYHFDDANTGGNDSTWVDITITPDTLVAGADALTLNADDVDTLVIKKSWGYQYFSSVIIQNSSGTNVDTLKPEDATYSGLATSIAGAAYSPSGFKSVALGDNGSITWNIDSLADGAYLANIFYQAPGGSQTGQLTFNGDPAASISFPSNSDSTGMNVQTSLFTVKDGKVTTQAGSQKALTLSGSNVLIDYIQLYQKTTAIESGNGQRPNAYSLSQNYPNPFNPTTNIRFKLPEASNVQLTVYNLLGQKVATLVNNRMGAGVHVVQFNASHLASGLYFYRLKAGNFVMNKKMMLIK